MWHSIIHKLLIIYRKIISEGTSRWGNKWFMLSVLLQRKIMCPCQLALGACWALLECLHQLFVCIKSSLYVTLFIKAWGLKEMSLSFSLYVLKSFGMPFLPPPPRFIWLQQQTTPNCWFERKVGGKNRENGKRQLSLLIISGFFLFFQTYGSSQHLCGSKLQFAQSPHQKIRNFQHVIYINTRTTIQTHNKFIMVYGKHQTLLTVLWCPKKWLHI